MPSAAQILLFKRAVLFSTKKNEVMPNQTDITVGGESKFCCIGEIYVSWLCHTDLHI